MSGIEASYEEYPIKNRDELEGTVKRKLTEPIINLISDYFDKCLRKNPWIISHGGMPRKLNSVILLHWLCEYESEKSYEQQFDVPHSTAFLNIDQFIPFLDTFSSHLIKWTSFENRKKQAHKLHPKRKKQLSETIVFESFHFRIQVMRDDPETGENGVLDSSNEFMGYKSLCGISPDTHFELVTEAEPAARHNNTRLLNSNLSAIIPYIDKDDVIVVGKGFESMEEIIAVGNWFPKNKQDKQAEILQAEAKKLIEDTFDKMKRTFNILHAKYRHHRKWIPAILRFCCAIHNLMLDKEASGKNFSEEWTGPVPRPAFHRKKRKGHPTEENEEQEEEFC